MPIPARRTARWRRFAPPDLRTRLGEAELPAGTGDRAQDIFARLAVAEAAVHGVEAEDVTFHEVGAWDSIADIVGAAHLIEQRGDARWSVSSLPIGAGTVRSAHGDLPLPAPAVVELLKGFRMHDDGRMGERITPTGAAILAHLGPDTDGLQPSGRLTESGIGFVTKEFAGISNVLRVLEFESAGAAIGEDQVAVLRFEIDDQSPEDLAAGLDKLRAEDGVLDVLQTPAFGKKGRIVAQIQVLARPDAREAVTAACFSETTTLGMRWELIRRAILERGSAATPPKKGGGCAKSTPASSTIRTTAPIRSTAVSIARPISMTASRRRPMTACFPAPISTISAITVPGSKRRAAMACATPSSKRALTRPACAILRATWRSTISPSCLSSRVETGLRIEGDQLALIDAVEKFITRRLGAHTVRCRIRKQQVVIELDADGLAALGDMGADDLRGVIAGMLKRQGIGKPLDFQPYRMGSAFLRPATHG